MKQPLALDCIPSPSFKERVDLWGRGDKQFWKGSWPTWNERRNGGSASWLSGVMARAAESQKLSWPPHAPAHIRFHTLNTGIQSHFKRNPSGVSWPWNMIHTCFMHVSLCILLSYTLIFFFFFFASGSSPLLSLRPLPIWGYTFIFLSDGGRDVWELPLG